MRKTKSKIISGILSAVMILSSLPVTVFADENIEETTVPTTESEVVYSEPTTEVVDMSFEETEIEPTDENVTSIPEDETESSQVDLDEDIDPLIDETTETSEATEETTETSGELETSESSEPTETEAVEPSETEETNETSETTEAPVELIVFDHYYTEIDESVVNTSDLFVQTSDASVFTLNTNVVSNYDDVYIIACDSVEEARYVYSYYVGKVDNITDLANVISIASDDNEDDVADLSNINNGEDAISNLNEIDVNDYSGYIALIDTGADADVNFSVVGDNTADSNGHGTAMLGYIREENPDAKVMSIKVFDDSNTTNAANVYAGIKLAIESNVSVINLSLVGADVEKNAIVKEVIQEAIDKDIIVIGSAGNYNRNAANYIPGCVNNVITVGAINEDGTKYATSNYNADLYVIATSTSEAAARYSGIYTSGNSSDKVYSEYIIPTPTVTPTATVTPVPTSVEDDFVDDRDFDTYSAEMAELGISVTIDENGNYVYNILEDNFEIAATKEESINDLGTISTPNLANYTASGYDNGTCLFTGSSGSGTVRSFVSTSHTSGGLTINDFGRDLISVCSRHWGEDQSRGAKSISGTNVQCYYQSTYTISYDSNASVYTVVFDIHLSQRQDMSQPQWGLTSGSTNYTVSSESGPSNLTRYSVTIGGSTTIVTGWVYAADSNAKKAIADKITSYVTNYVTAEYSGNRDISIGSINTSIGNHSVSYNYYTSSQTQVFRSQLIARQGRSADTINTDLSIHKVFRNNTAQVIPNAAFVVSVNSNSANTAATNYVTTYDLVNAVYSAARPGRNQRYSDLLGKLGWVDAALQGDERTVMISLVDAFTNSEHISWDLDALGSALLGRSWTHPANWNTAHAVVAGVVGSDEFRNGRYYTHSSIPSGTSILYTDNNGIALNPIGLGTITPNSPTTATQTYYYREAQSNRVDAATDSNLYRVTISATGTYNGNNLTAVTYNRSVYNQTTGALLYQGSVQDSQDIGVRVGNSSGNTDFADESTYENHYIELELRTNKVDDQSHPSRGATFTVYDDASCTSNHAIGTMTLSGNNTYTYDFGDLDSVRGVANSFSTKKFTYYIKETSPATQVLINGTWQNANFGANNTVYSVTFTWNPNNDTISGQSATGGTVTSSSANNITSVTATFGTSNGNTVNVTNVSASASIDVVKVAKVNNTTTTYPAGGAVFTVYRDAACTQVVGTIRDSNHNADYSAFTFNNSTSGWFGNKPRNDNTDTTITYYIKETTAPTGYYVGNTWHTASFNIDSTVKQIKFTWNPSTGNLTYSGSFFSSNRTFTRAANATSTTGSTVAGSNWVNNVNVSATATANLNKVAQVNGTTNRYATRGAVFTVYSNAACTNVVGTITSDNNGNYSGINFTSGTTNWFSTKPVSDSTTYTANYWVRETTAPTAYKVDNTWISATFVRDTTIYTLTYSWVPSTGTLTASGTFGTGSSNRASSALSTSLTTTVTKTNVITTSATATANVNKVATIDGTTNTYTARGAVFTIYSDSNCTNAIGTIHDNNNDGTYTAYAFNSNTTGWFTAKPVTDTSTYNLTYYVKETTTPNAYRYNNNWVSATFVPDNTKYTITFAWTPSTGNITMGGTFGESATANRAVTSITTSVSDVADRPNVITVTSNADVSVNKVTTIDGTAYVARNAVFTIYSDASCTNAIGTIRDPNHNGTYSTFTFDGTVANWFTATAVTSTAAQTRTYYVKETSTPDGYKNGNTWYDATFVPDNTTYTIVFTWYPSRTNNALTIGGTFGTSSTANRALNSTIVHGSATSTRDNTVEVTATGSFTITKVDNQGRNAYGATFGIYSDEACTNRITTLTSTTNTFTYNNISFGPTSIKSSTAQVQTYYVKELTPSTSVLINGSRVDVNCMLDETIYEVKITWVPSRTINTLTAVVTNLTTNTAVTTTANRTAGRISSSISNVRMTYVNIPMYSVNTQKNGIVGNNFDPSDVTFEVYRLSYIDVDGSTVDESSNPTLIARTSSVSENGIPTWSTANGLVDPTAKVDGHYQLYEGTYRIVEHWTERQITPLSGENIIVHSTNVNGWVQDNDYTYHIDVQVNAETANNSVYPTISATNREESGYIRVSKRVTVAGDAGEFTFELWQGNNKLAIGTAVSDGTVNKDFIISWTEVADGVLYRDGDDTQILLPLGDYEVREIAPTTHYYKDTTVPYTYGTPEGWTAVGFDAQGASDGTAYFAKDITVATPVTNNTMIAATMTCGNTRQDGEIDITKVADNQNVTLTFEIYYHGNGALYDNDTRILLDTITLEASSRDQAAYPYGYGKLEHVPYGWYEIVEVADYPGYTEVIWMANSAGFNYGDADFPSRMVCIRPTDNQLVTNLFVGSATAIDLHHPTYTIYKYDQWQHAGVIISSDYANGLNGLVGGCTFTLYEDIDGDGVLDDNEKSSYKAILDYDQDGVVKFTKLDYAKHYIVIESGTVDGYYQTLNTYAFCADYIGEIEQDIDNTPYNVPIEIYKIDEAYTNDTEARHYLSGAEFTIYVDTTTDGVFDGTQPIAQTLDANGNVVNATVTETVDENGHPVYVSDPLHFGSYFVVETKAPDGYAMIEGESVQRITINAVDTTAVDFVATPVTTNVNNTCRNYIYLTKVDKLFPEVNLENAVFTVYRDENGNGEVDENDTLMGNMVEYSAGQYRFGNPTMLRAGDFSAGLPKGTYLVVETEAPMWNGERVFEARDFVWSVTIDEDISLKDGYEITDVDYDGVWNDAFGSITINKVEEANHQSLAGAEFTIYNDVNENGTYEADIDTVYAVRTTTSTGIISLEHMPRGQYIVKETAAPEYYETDPNYYVVTISLDKLNWVVDNITWEAITGVRGEFINHNPIIGTNLTDVATVEHVGVNIEVAHLIDVVEYNGLHVGETYVMEGVLYDKNTGELYLDAEGNEVRNSVTFTPETESGFVEVPFSFPVEQKVISVVAAEKVRHENEENYVGIHYDLTDENQEVDFPGIHTTLLSNVTEEHVAPNMGTITLVDTVTYENIVPNLEYIMRGTLMNKETGATFVDANGRPITSEIKFTPNTANGTVDITFMFDANLLEDSITLVAFESLIIVVDDNDVVITTHNDINDVDQTVNIPTIHTTFFDRNLADADDFDHATVGEEVTLVDTVHYEDITPGLEYTLYGTIMIKETNSPLRDSEGNVVEIRRTFTPTTSTGDVEVEFTVNTTELKGKTLVAFETLEYNGVTLVVHADINDNDQTVHVPNVHTTAVDSVDNDKIIDGGSHEQTIVDAVAYTNLVPGRTYTVTGKLVVKKDYAEGEEYEYVKDADGNIVTSSTTFTPTTANGSVDVIFTVDASIYAGERIVVFEDVYCNNKLIITHSDINDEDQTIEISLLLHVKIAKADKDNVAYYLKDAEITIFNADGTIAYDVDGNPCVGITNENGEVEFTLVYDRENTYYAQETKAPAGYNINPEKFEITPTSDRESEGICLIPVTILDTIIVIPPKTGDNMNLGLYAMLTVLSTCGLAGGCFYLFKRRKEEA